MSWQAYVDDHLMCEISPGHWLLSAAIIGQGGTEWAQSDSFPEVSETEFANIMNGFEENTVLSQNGLFLGGRKYMVVQGEPGVIIRGKKGPGGCCISKTRSALVFGIYDEPTTQGECNMVVEKLGAYLIDQEI